MPVLAKFTKDPEAVLDYTIRWGAPQWQAAQSYTRRDVVYNVADATYYECKITHTSGGALSDDKAKWKALEDLWLDGEAGEQIAGAATWSVPSGLTLDAQSEDGYTATAWFSGGTAGQSYEIVCHIVSDNVPAREDDRTVKITVKER